MGAAGGKWIKRVLRACGLDTFKAYVSHLWSISTSFDRALQRSIARIRSIAASGALTR